MAENENTNRHDGEGAQVEESVLDLFEPAPERDPNSFGKVPVVREDEIDLTDNASSAEIKAAAEAEAAGLQHWTAPPTGQVPAVLSAETGESGLWGDVKGPSWHGDDPSWDGPDLADVFADTDSVNLDATPEQFDDVDDDEEEDEHNATIEYRDSAHAPPRSASSRPPVARESSRGADRDVAIDEETGPTFRGVRDPLPLPGVENDALDNQARVSTPRPPVVGDNNPLAQRQQSPERPAKTRRAPRPQTASSPDQDRRTIPDPAGRPAQPMQRLRINDEELSQHEDELSGIDQTGIQAKMPVPPRRRQIIGAAHELPDEPAGRPAGSGLPDLDDIEFAGGDYYDEDDEDPFGLEESGGRNVPIAIAVGVGLAAIVVAAMYLGPNAMMVVVSVLALLAVLEVYNAMRMAGLRPATLLGIVGTVAAPVAAYYRGDAAFPLIVALSVVFGALWYLVGADSERPVLNLSLTMMGIFWVGGLAAFASLILRSDQGLWLLAATIIVTVASDTMAYVGGRAYGSKPFHQASPNKTWEGTMTGFAGAMFAGFAIGVTNLGSIWEGNFVAAILLGAVVGALAPAGDLAESVVKRDLGVKDMGTLLPGHGGVMDRIDGLLFALPGAYYLALIYGLI